ncbi:MAG: hypothetical protein ABSF35_15005 [Polyangia bacterium]|jgi:hypothetical protein
MNLLRGIAEKPALIVLAMALAVACSSSKRTLVEVNVSLDSQVSQTPPVTVTVTVTSNGAPVASGSFPWSKAQGNILYAGVYLPDDAPHLVDIAAAGLDTQGGEMATASLGNQRIVAGQTNGPYALTLQPATGTVTPGLDAGSPDVLPPDLATSDVAPVVPEGGSADLLAVDAGGAESAPGTPDGGNVDVPAVDVNLPDVPLPPSDGPAVDAPIADAGSDTGETETDASPFPTWQPASNVENDIIDRSYTFAVAVEPIAENVYVAWTEDYAVKVKRWDWQSGTWGSTTVIDDRDLTSGEIGIGADAAGHVSVVWGMDRTTSVAGVWASRADSSVAATWSPPVLIASGTVFNVQLGVARNGIARIVYSGQPGSNQEDHYVAYFDGTSWTADPAPVLDVNSPSNPQVNAYSPPVLAVGGTGDAVVVFDEYDADQNISVGVVNLTGQTKTAPQILDTNLTEDILYRTVAMNRNSDAVVSWGESTGLWVSTYKTGGAWSSPQKIKGNADCTNIGSALDDQDNLTVAWAQSLSTSGYNAVAIHGQVGGTWSDITPLETDNVASYLDVTKMPYPNLAADAQGNVLVVWSKQVNDTTWGAYASRLQGATWQPQVQLGQRANLRAWNPVVAAADSGFGASSFIYYATSADGTTSDTQAYNVEVAFYR